MPLPKESEILFGGEYVMLGNIDAPTTLNDAMPEQSKAEDSQEAEDMKNEGDPGEAPQLVSTDKESPMKVKEKEKEKKPGPTKEELEKREREKREQEKADKIKKRVAFSSTGSGSGTQGSPNGNSDNGARSGAPGHSLKGRTLESWGKPSSTVDGRIVIEVRVDPRGRVISAIYKSGSGSAAASAQVRRSCEQASKQSRFSVSKESTIEQVGTIVWKFE